MEVNRFEYFKKQTNTLLKCDLNPPDRIGLEFLQKLFPEMENLAHQLEDAGIVDTMGGEVIFMIAASFLVGMLGADLNTESAVQVKQFSDILMHVINDMQTQAKALQQAEKKPAN